MKYNKSIAWESFSKYNDIDTIKTKKDIDNSDFKTRSHTVETKWNIPIITKLSGNTLEDKKRVSITKPNVKVQKSQQNDCSNKSDDSNYNDSSCNDSRTNHRNYNDTRSSDCRSSDIRSSDRRSSDIRTSDIRSSDIRSSDIRSSDIRSSDIRSSDIRSSDRRSSDIRSSDHRWNDHRWSDHRWSDHTSNDHRSNKHTHNVTTGTNSKSLHCQSPNQLDNKLCSWRKPLKINNDYRTLTKEKSTLPRTLTKEITDVTYSNKNDCNAANDDEFRRDFLVNKSYCITESLYINKIVPILSQTEFQSFKDIHLLENETIIITYIYKYLNTTKHINESMMIQLLEYILNISVYFEKKLKMPKIYNFDRKNIKRSSYKFCNFKDECKYNYHDGNGCYAHHYVHNMVSADIASLILFIENNRKNNSEIIKCCNMLSYVIKHMYDELYNVIYYSTNVKNTDSLHKNNYSRKSEKKCVKKKTHRERI